MSYLAKKIESLLSGGQKLKARDIAYYVGSDKHSVNSVLYGELSSVCTRDDDYYWSLRGPVQYPEIYDEDESYNDYHDEYSEDSDEYDEDEDYGDSEEDEDYYDNDETYEEESYDGEFSVSFAEPEKPYCSNGIYYIQPYYPKREQGYRNHEEIENSQRIWDYKDGQKEAVKYYTRMICRAIKYLVLNNPHPFDITLLRFHLQRWMNFRR